MCTSNTAASGWNWPFGNLSFLGCIWRLWHTQPTAKCLCLTPSIPQEFHIMVTEAALRLSGHNLKKAGLKVSNPTSTYYSFHGMQQSVLFQSSAYYWFIRWYDKIVNDFYSNLHASSHFLIFWEVEEKKKSKKSLLGIEQRVSVQSPFPPCWLQLIKKPAERETQPNVSSKL